MEEKKKEEKAQAEAAEYDKWKDMFSVDAEGTDEVADEGKSQALIQEFVDYIKVREGERRGEGG